MGAGSFRDMANLNKLGVDCSGTDYSETSVNNAKKYFDNIAHKIFQSDAFYMNNIQDDEYDVTFHNGLWVLFENDDDILNLAKEQARISKNKMIVTVHNAHNQKFTEYFEKLAENDPLYKIRFFSINEIEELMLKVCKSISIYPVGKGKKYFEDQMINEGNHSRESLNSFFRNTKLANLENSERLMCIGNL
jgi:hypothetical protein